jgi:hypothetical protein
MNWTLGLQRLWIVASIVLAVWVCSKSKSAGEAIVVSALFSAAMYAAGAGVIWVMRGFQRKQS